MVNQSTSVESLRLEPGRSVDCTSLLPVDVSSLPRGLHARTLCFHPLRPLLALGVQNYVGAFDLLSGCRMGRVDVRTPAVHMAFSADGSLLVVATQEWHIIGINSVTWRSRVIAPCREAKSSALDSILMAITAGRTPMVFFTRPMKDSVRLVFATGRSAAALEAAGKRAASADKTSWGLKLKLDVKKGVIGLAAPPRDPALIVLFADGALRGYAISAAGLTPMYTTAVDPLSARATSSFGLLECHPHPFIAGGASIMLYGTKAGSITIFESVGLKEPRLLLRARTPDNLPVIGMGLHKDSRTVMAFLATPDGGCQAVGWQLFAGTPKAPGVTVAPIPIELDGLDPPVPAAAGLEADTTAAPKAAGGKAAGQQGDQAAATPSWQTLWGSGSSVESSEEDDLLLARLLAPVVNSAALHPSLGVVAVQRMPPPALRQASQIMMQAIGLISPAEAALSRRTAAVPLLRVMNDAQPAGYWPGGALSPMHTGLHFWQGGMGLTSTKLQFPCHLYFLGPSKVCKYSLVTKATGAFAALPDTDAAGHSQQARYVLHSPKQNAWLVFFEGMEAPEPRSGASSSAGSGDAWRFTLVRDGMTDTATWFLPGKHGAFLGPQDMYFAILPGGSTTVSVYLTPSFKGKGPAAYTIQLDNPSRLGPGLWAGPAAPGAPKVGAIAAAAAKEERDAAGLGDGQQEEQGQQNEEDGYEAAESAYMPVLGVASAPAGRMRSPFTSAAAQVAAQDKASHSGGGVIMWQMVGHKLALAGMPEPGVQYAAGEDSDDPDADPDEGSALKAASMGTVHPEHTLQLQSSERVISVSWQNLTQAPSELPQEPHQAAAAILTTQRLMIVSGDLTLLASVDAACGSLGVPNSITSFVWAGPALLYMTAAGQVMQLTWTSATHHVCSVAAHPPAILAGVLADSLLLLRHNPTTGEAEVASRAVGLLQPLVLGWCSLAAAGLLPKGLATARAALQSVLQNWDATHITSGLLWTLMNSWCWDVAAELAAHGTNVDPTVRMAANAAAGKWSLVVTELLGEYERSVFYPKPVPRSTQLHSKFLAAAAGAIMLGQFSRAQECLRCAGEWETSLALAVAQADFTTLRQLANMQSTSTSNVGGVLGDKEAQDIARLARALTTAYEQEGRTFSTATAKDWNMRLVMADDSFFSNASDWVFGSNGKLPSMETSSFNAPSSFIQDGEVGPIPRADTSAPGVFLGLSDVAATTTAAADGDAASSTGDLLDFGMLGTAASASGSGVEQMSRASTDSLNSAGGTAANPQSSARDDFFGLGKAEDGFSDEDDEADASLSAYNRNKIKIVIKSKEEAAAAAQAGGISAGPTGGSVSAPVDLKEAAQRLKLSGLAPPPGAGRGGPAGALSGRLGRNLVTATSSGDLDISSLASPDSADLGPSTSARTTAPQLAKPAGALPPRTPARGGNLLSPTGSTANQPVLGGPPMRPKASDGGINAALPVISDEDFMEALGAAPVAPAKSAKQPAMQVPGVGAAPPPPSRLQQQQQQQQQQRLQPPVVPTAKPAAPTTATPAAKPAATAAAAAKPAPAPQAAAAASGGDATALYLQGVAHMESASWRPAADAFAATLAALAAEPFSEGRQARAAFAAQYLACVLLLERAVQGSGEHEAMLYRYIAALPLDDRHTLALVKESVARNKHIGNYKYCADQLTNLVTKSLGSAPMDVMARLQEEIDECDRKGGTNASMPANERTDDFVAILGAATSRQDVEEAVQPLIAGA